MKLTSNQLDLVREWAESFAHYGTDAQWYADRTFYDDCADDLRLFPMIRIIEDIIEGHDLTAIFDEWFTECNTANRLLLLDIQTFCRELHEYADRLPGGSEIVTPDAGTPFEDGVMRVLQDAKFEIYSAVGWC